MLTRLRCYLKRKYAGLYFTRILYTLQELKEKNITLSDLETKEHDIELLLGADVIGNILTGNSLKLSSGVTVVQTKFGYTVIGKTNTIYNNLYSNVVSLHCANFTVTDLWNLDAIGITDPTEDAKRKHAHSDFLNQFKENLSVLPDGRYELPLPFKFETQLPNNKSATIKRHKRMCQRIDEQNQLNDYEVVFRQWEDLQIIEKVPETEIDNFGYYLPHRPVIKQASQTMKIRPVFDASARDKNQPSLNDCLNRGPNLIELIPDIIDRFRLYPIGLSSDIEKAFLQLSIIPEHRDYLRFFFLLLKKLKFTDTAELCLKSVLPHSNFLLSPARFDDVTQKLKHSFYVDNCVTGVSDIQEQENFIVKAIEVMAKGCFNLRGWESNVPGRYISRSSGVTSLLGLLWDLDKDTLKCNFNYSGEDRLACETSEVEREKRKVRLCNLVAVEGEIPWYAIKFSNFQSIIRFVSWMLQFVKNTKKKPEFREIGDLTVHEIEHAEKTLIKIV
ncbi:putative RNA-directed DNA polymerase from transposon X-element [Trichonephila inaurata madagascariensis]|uniref:Putative RNA-directed DNA polymerase from transposon X-element n=1 Tax=Trichonephila inaurata madagascariensis TaxID=2747483 RepID=A0A8X6M8D8_9ARAC|nr:putative RNA-directed DNA polymerase from transposon X-element [Trichonephila inaurata madagascariensis]